MATLTSQQRRALQSIGLSLEKVVKEAVDKRLSRRIAKTVIDEIQTRTARGVNPIKGWSRRYPAYKGAKAQQEATRFLRGVKDSELKREFRKRFNASKRKAYPFSVQKDYPGKKQRPVNLRLSGDMMDDLGYEIDRSVDGSARIEIDYRSSLNQAKEEGHREGINGQPKRPTLPLVEKNEEFISPIQQIVRKMVRSRIDKIIKDFNRRAKRVI